MTDLVNTAAGVAALIKARLETIQVANGYETDIGLQVYQGKVKIEDDLIGAGAVSIIEGIDAITSRPGRQPLILTDQRYALVAYMPCDPDNPNLAAHTALRDLKRAFFTGTQENGSGNFNGAVKKVTYYARDIGPRADGAKFVIALIEIGVEYVEDLSNP